MLEVSENPKPLPPRALGAACAWWLVLLTLLLAAAHTAGAEPARRQGPVPIGTVAELWGPTADMIGLQDGLVARGYRQDVDFTLGSRSAEGDPAALTAIVRSLAEDGAEIIYVSGWSALQVARKARAGRPIVFATWYGPRQAGLAGGFREPGEQIAGAANRFHGVSPQALHVLRSLMPGLKRVLLPYDADELYLPGTLRALRAAASRLRISLVERPVRSREEARLAVAGAREDGAEAILPVGGSLNLAGYALEASHRPGVPALFPRAWMADYGGLASYGPSWYGLGKIAARVVDKILKGAKAEEIPIELNRAMELVINLRTAQRLGITVPPETLARAHRIIRP